MAMEQECCYFLIIIMIIIIRRRRMIVFKGAIQDCYNFFTALRIVSNTYAQVSMAQSRANHVQITCNTSSAYHVQHVVHHVVQRDSSVIQFDRVGIAFISALFYWLKPVTDEREEETGVPGENR